MVQDTSKKTYRELNEERYIETLKEQVLSIIQRFQPINDRRIAAYATVPINSIVARRNELVVDGLVKEDHIEEDSDTRRSTIYWGLGKQEKVTERRLSEVELNNLLTKITRSTVFQARIMERALVIHINRLKGIEKREETVLDSRYL